MNSRYCSEFKYVAILYGKNRNVGEKNSEKNESSV